MKTKIFIILVGALLLFSTMKGVLGNPTFQNILDGYTTTAAIENGPELGRYMHLIAMADNHTYALTRAMVQKGPDYGYSGGKYFSLFAPGVAYLTLPSYLFGKYFHSAMLFTFGFVGLISIINFLLLYTISRKIFSLPNWISVLVVIIFGFASTAWNYETLIYQHAFTTLAMLSSFYAVWRYRQNTRFSYLWAIVVWVGYGAAIFFDYPNIILMLPIMVYFLLSAIDFNWNSKPRKFRIRKSIFIASIFFIILIALHGYHNYKYFGSWKKIGSNIISLDTLRQAKVFDTPNIETFIATKAPPKEISKNLQEKNLFSSFYTLTFALDKGLFIFSPIFLLALWGMFNLRKKLTIEHSVWMALFLINLFFYCGWGDPWGGWAYGPRYLFPSMAVLSVFVGVWLHYNRGLIYKLLLTLFFIYSSGVALLGALTTTQLRPRTLNDGTKHNYLYNLDFLKANKGSSFIYNTYLSHSMTLIEYYFIIFAFLFLVFMYILFILSRYEHKREEERVGDEAQEGLKEKGFPIYKKLRGRLKW